MKYHFRSNRLSKYLFLFSFVVLLAFTSVHKYYVSVTQIEYVKDQASVQIISRIFIDDFERLLRERYDEGITLDVPDELSTVDYYTEKYLKEKLSISIDGKIRELTFIGKEYEDDILFVYLEITGIEVINTMEISNEVLFDVYEEQQNVVRTKINDRNKSFILIKENAKGVLNF